MALFDFLKKRGDEDQVQEIFHKIHKEHQAKELVDKAISYRNLGKFDDAIAILRESLRVYPYYSPAKSVLGNTFWAKGDIASAEKEYLRIIADDANKEDFGLLIETYANLGLIHYSVKKDKQKALKYYNLGLVTPKPKNVSDEGYRIMLADIYRDLIVLYSKEENWDLLKKYALLRLECTNNCPVASVVYGFCLINEYVTTVYDRSRSPLESEDKSGLLTNAAKYFTNVLSENPKNYPALSGLAVAMLHLRILFSMYSQFSDKAHKKFGLTKEMIASALQSTNDVESRALGALKKSSQGSVDAKVCFDSYQSQAMQIKSFLGLK